MGGGAPGWGLSQEDQATIKSLEFSDHPPLFQRGEGAGHGVNDLSHLREEAPQNPSCMGFGDWPH